MCIRDRPKYVPPEDDGLPKSLTDRLRGKGASAEAEEFHDTRRHSSGHRTIDIANGFSYDLDTDGASPKPEDVYKRQIFDNLISFDLHQKARELHVECEVPRAVLYIKVTSGTESGIYEVIRNMYPDKEHDFVISIDSRCV